MTIATERFHEFTIAQIVSSAYRLAGLTPAGHLPTGARAAVGRELLQYIIQDLETEGLCARNVVFEDVPVVAGTEAYTLPGDVLELAGMASWVPQGEDAELPETATTLAPISRDTWLALPNRTQQGRPTLFWEDRTAGAPIVHLHPVPDAAGTVRFQVQRLRAQMLDGNATPDLETYFAEYLRWRLAHDLALENVLPMDRVMYLASQAGAKRERMLAVATQGASSIIHMGHCAPRRR